MPVASPWPVLLPLLLVIIAPTPSRRCPLSPRPVIGVDALLVLPAPTFRLREGVAAATAGAAGADGRSANPRPLRRRRLDSRRPLDLDAVMPSSASSGAAPVDAASRSRDEMIDGDGDGARRGEFLVLWRGERAAGYSSDLRRLELSGAVAAETVAGSADDSGPPPPRGEMLNFGGALVADDDDDASLEGHDGDVAPPGNADGEALLEYVSMGDGGGRGLTSEILARAAGRCALVRSVFAILSEVDRAEADLRGDDSPFRRLAKSAMSNGSLDDMMAGGINERATWCIRAKQYDAAGDPIRERVMFREMSPLLERLGGDVELKRPDVQLYVLDGLRERGILLARKLADGVQASSFAPNTRACTSATPLCPIAAFAMCNVAMIRSGSTVLDPFAGSCTTLLAASKAAAATFVSPSSRIRTVGIEISLGDKGLLKDRILVDFSNRGLPPPVALIRGDCRSGAVRDEARAAICRGRGRVGFDAIVTDPPYGMRESMNGGGSDGCGSSYVPPLAGLFSAMAADLRAGSPLLKNGGRLVAFVPVQQSSAEGGMDISDMPNSDQIAEAGLSLVAIRHQRLSSSLSRAMVVFESRFQREKR